ncbi:MAG: GNAT family N-acetyltransferase [Paraclostridium sp.]
MSAIDNSLEFTIVNFAGHINAVNFTTPVIYKHNKSFVIFDFDDENVIVINGLFIEEPFRNKGHGSKLLTDLVNQIKSNTNLRILLHCEPELVKFYHLNGFTITRQIKGMYELTI